MTTIRLTLDVEIDEEGVESYRERYPDMTAPGEDYATLLAREAYSTWQWDGLVTDVRLVEREVEDG